MEALAVRLSQLDSHAEGALRVVMFYDTLMRRRVEFAVHDAEALDVPRRRFDLALGRASAGLAECVAGIQLAGCRENAAGRSFEKDRRRHFWRRGPSHNSEQPSKSPHRRREVPPHISN